MDEGKQITPEQVRSLTGPTDKFLCSLTDNVYDIKFGAFRIRDMESGFILVDVTDQDSVD